MQVHTHMEEEVGLNGTGFGGVVSEQELVGVRIEPNIGPTRRFLCA